MTSLLLFPESLETNDSLEFPPYNLANWDFMFYPNIFRSKCFPLVLNRSLFPVVYRRHNIPLIIFRAVEVFSLNSCPKFDPSVWRMLSPSQLVFYLSVARFSSCWNTRPTLCVSVASCLFIYVETLETSDEAYSTLLQRLGGDTKHLGDAMGSSCSISPGRTRP